MSLLKGKETESNSSISGSTQPRIFTLTPLSGDLNTSCKDSSINLSSILNEKRRSCLDFDLLSADSWWTIYQLECSTMQRSSVFLSQKGNRWESTRACGMQTIGPREVVWSRLTGPRLLSQLTTEDSMLRLAPFLQDVTLSSRVLLVMVNCKWRTSSMLMVGGDSDGFRSTSWSIIIVLISKGSLVDSLPNARGPESDVWCNSLHDSLLVWCNS